MDKKELIKEELTELLNKYYNGSFSEMVCDYIHATGMTKEEVEELLEAMKDFHARAINNQGRALVQHKFLCLFYALRHLLRISYLAEMLHFPRKKEASIFGVYAVKQ